MLRLSPVSPGLKDAAIQLLSLLATSTKPEEFEKIVMLHQAVRGMTASHLALWQGRKTVSAHELHFGTDCSRAFTKREFVPVTDRLLMPPVAASPWQLISEAERHIPLQRGGSVDVLSDNCVLHLGGTNAVDAVWSNWSPTNSANRPIVTVLDTKHVAADSKSGRLTEALVREWVTKRKDLQKTLSTKRLPVNVLAVLASLALRREKPNVVSEWLEGVCKDDWTCVISSSDQRLQWGLSPALADLLKTKAVDVKGHPSE